MVKNELVRSFGSRVIRACTWNSIQVGNDKDVATLIEVNIAFHPPFRRVKNCVRDVILVRWGLNSKLRWVDHFFY